MTPTASGAVRSKTVWFGAILAGLGLLQTSLHDVVQIPPEYMGLINTLIGVAIVVLRTVTTEGLTEKGNEAISAKAD